MSPPFDLMTETVPISNLTVFETECWFLADDVLIDSLFFMCFLLLVAWSPPKYTSGFWFVGSI